VTENSNRRPARHESAGEGGKENITAGSEALAGSRWFPSRKWLAILFAISLGANAALVSYDQFRSGGRSRASAPPEVSLGEYRFSGFGSPEHGIIGAAFSVHVALLNETDREAQERLAARHHRIRQGVEEVLRRARSGDFEDPALGDLKRQLQERINAILEMRAIAEVVVTDLVLQRTDLRGEGAPDPAETALSLGPAVP
jgi:hypothetical protein